MSFGHPTKREVERQVPKILLPALDFRIVAALSPIGASHASSAQAFVALQQGSV